MTILHKNELGTIVQCNCCNEFQINIEHMVLILTKEEFSNFSYLINKISLNEIYENDISKQFMLVTPLKGVAFKLSFHELFLFKELIDISNLILTTKEILNVKTN
tara:strand:+ start:4102 stop:4416 length:315 start_codon:yes stop_codon:yes gene_type:complete